MLTKAEPLCEVPTGGGPEHGGNFQQEPDSIMPKIEQELAGVTDTKSQSQLNQSGNRAGVSPSELTATQLGGHHMN